MSRPITALLLVAAVVAFVVGDRIAAQRAVVAEANRARATAILLASGFRRELEKFRLASIVLAEDPDAVAALAGRKPADLQALSAKFEALSAEMDVAAVYLLDGSGTTLAASNWRLPTSFVGTKYDFRAYFRETIRSGKFEQFALGSVSRRPGLYVARRVGSGAAPTGVVVVKVEFDALEAEWRESGNPAFATNQRGIILVTSVAEWRFQTTIALPSATQRQIQANLEFGDAPLSMNALFEANEVAAADSAAAFTKPYVEVVQSVPSDWTVHVLASTTAPVRTAVTNSRLVVLTGLLLVAALAAFGFYRRKAASDQAERLVNARLRVMNDRLMQANKLASLGQIAAGVGHEINQPVAAISAYAENGTRFIAAGNIAEANENLKRIVSLTERIGMITRELRGFARKATGVNGSVAIDVAVEGALLLLRDRIRTLSATIEYRRAGGTVMVVAEHARLEQVLVNLIQNALDAGGPGTAIVIQSERHAQMLEVAIRDNGPGLSKQARAELFQPFSTSKIDGLGLGLIISRDIMADFGGELVAGNPLTGAEFIMRLRCATCPT